MKANHHLNALLLRLSHEREHLASTATEDGRKLRLVWIAQIEKEIAAERAFLGLPPEQPLPEMTDEELIAAIA